MRIFRRITPSLGTGGTNAKQSDTLKAVTRFFKIWFYLNQFMYDGMVSGSTTPKPDQSYVRLFFINTNL